jgi:hypothetical protein
MQFAFEPVNSELDLLTVNSEQPWTTMIGVRNLEPGTRNPETGIQKPESGNRKPETGIRNPENGIKMFEPAVCFSGSQIPGFGPGWQARLPHRPPLHQKYHQCKEFLVIYLNVAIVLQRGYC